MTGDEDASDGVCATSPHKIGEWIEKANDRVKDGAGVSTKCIRSSGDGDASLIDPSSSSSSNKSSSTLSIDNRHYHSCNKSCDGIASSVASTERRRRDKCTVASSSSSSSSRPLIFNSDHCMCNLLDNDNGTDDKRNDTIHHQYRNVNNGNNIYDNSGTACTSVYDRASKLIADRILGLTINSKGDLLYLVKWKNYAGADLIDQSTCRSIASLSQLIIDFYQRKAKKLLLHKTRSHQLVQSHQEEEDELQETLHDDDDDDDDTDQAVADQLDNKSTLRAHVTNEMDNDNDALVTTHSVCPSSVHPASSAILAPSTSFISSQTVHETTHEIRAGDGDNNFTGASTCSHGPSPLPHYHEENTSHTVQTPNH